MQIKSGATRTVFIFRKVVIKLPNPKKWRLFLYGLLANMQEKEFSKLQHIKLCPVLFGFPGGFFIVMKKAEPLTTEQYNSIDFASWIECNNMFIPVEDKQSSFGLLNGNIVAVDYGS